MRIVGGQHRSRTLVTPKDSAVRPTSDKVRQAIFNILNSRGLVVDAVVIDAFCGTGALGLEALSQGAHFASFFDKSKESIKLCQQNIELLKVEAQSHVSLKDITKIGNRPDNIDLADLIFIDPPYHQDLVNPAIEALVSDSWVKDNASLVIETAKNEKIYCPLINVELEKTYGDTKIMLCTLK